MTLLEEPAIDEHDILLDRLGRWNHALHRLGAQPLVTADEAVDLPTDHLATITAATGDRLTTLARDLTNHNV